jgi:hydroxymethylpyrimidine pyrophosphatase-like HAD family hydrolase
MISIAAWSRGPAAGRESAPLPPSVDAACPPGPPLMEAFVQRFAACVFDMDGTLCTSRDHPDGQDHITTTTAAALSKYVAAGGMVVVATGRPPDAATRVINRDLAPGVVSYVVCCDGGCVLAPAADQTSVVWAPVWEMGLSGACCVRFLNAIRAHFTTGKLHFGVQLHEGFDGWGSYGSIASSRRVQELLEESNPQWGEVISNMVETGQRTPEDVAERSPRVLDAPEAFDTKAAQAGSIGWVRIVHEVDGSAAGSEQPQDLSSALEPLVEAENAAHGSGIEFVKEHLAGPHTAMLRQAGTDKATALAVVADMLGVNAADCCVFGDGDNDVGMFRWAGWAVAPSNCGPAVRIHYIFTTYSHGYIGWTKLISSSIF